MSVEQRLSDSVESIALESVEVSASSEAVPLYTTEISDYFDTKQHWTRKCQLLLKLYHSTPQRYRILLILNNTRQRPAVVSASSEAAPLDSTEVSVSSEAVVPIGADETSGSFNATALGNGAECQLLSRLYHSTVQAQKSSLFTESGCRFSMPFSAEK